MDDNHGDPDSLRYVLTNTYLNEIDEDRYAPLTGAGSGPLTVSVSHICSLGVASTRRNKQLLPVFRPLTVISKTYLEPMIFGAVTDSSPGHGVEAS